MTKYLFLILDRYEASFSSKSEIKSKLKPKLVFRNCMIGVLGKGDAVAIDIIDEIMEQVCMRGDFVTYDSEKQSFLLIKLEN